MTAAIFYSPHADDLLLSMGASIIDHLDLGRKCVFVLMTQGSSDWVRQEISNRVGYNVSTNDVTLCRLKELLDEVTVYSKLGLTSVVINNFTDGTLTVDQVKLVATQMERLYPGADHKTMTYVDSHRDHANCGEALRQLYSARAITKAPRYYVKRSDMLAGRTKQFNPWSITADSLMQSDINKAAAGYKLWNPAAGRFSVGYISVGGEFDQLARGAVNYLHA